ncbi:MAG: DUF2254 domain-containing protein [Rhodobacter sp.]|nr:DUF2254 domain-containing protein [Rhodobacter sp.]
MLGIAKLSKTYFRLWRYSRRLGVRATALAGLALLAVLLAPLLAPIVPDWLADSVKAESVSRILQVMAASMLSVTIFSLSVMVSARQAASAQVTPRSHQVLMEDTTTQNVLATFLGSFIFSLTAMIVMDTEFYATGAPAVILGISLVVVALVVVAILRWIDHLSELGSVGETAARIERAATRAIEDRRTMPCLGARPLTPGQLEIPARAERFQAWDTGYVQHIDLRGLSRAAGVAGGSVFVVAQPGELVSPGDALLYHTIPMPEEKLRAAFTIADNRVFEQDPRFGVIVLSEIAQRALSPGVNDPGTAIDMLTRLARVLAHYRAEANVDCEPALAHVWMSPVTPEELMRDAFDPIARDAASTVEVQIRLQKTLALLSHSGDSEMEAAARASSARALALSLEAQSLPEHRERLRELAKAV